MEYHKKYLEKLYPLQDDFLKFFDGQNQHRFYLTGGTALSRFYFSLFDRVDNEKNILSNKICCISRHEVKDIADIWILAKRQSFLWREIMDIANKKSPVDPIEVSKIIKTLPRKELKLIQWTSDINIHEVFSDLQIIAEDILLGNPNSLKTR